MATERSGEFQIPARDSGSGSHLIKKIHSSIQLKVAEAAVLKVNRYLFNTVPGTGTPELGIR
jgi:transcriptional regulator of met regulon